MPHCIVGSASSFIHGTWNELEGGGLNQMVSVHLPLAQDASAEG